MESRNCRACLVVECIPRIKYYIFFGRFFHAGRDIPAKDHFTPQILLDEIQDLGIIIDLTATTRYYNPREFEDNDVQYIKILTQGHQVPSHNVVSKFTIAVKNFLERNGHNDKKIGVHCTHGVNRTGYLICHYMITQMKLDSKIAIESFANCRGYPIERNNYIESLNSLLPEVPVPKNNEYRDSIDKRNNLLTDYVRVNRTQRISRVSRVTDRDDHIWRDRVLPSNYDLRRRDRSRSNDVTTYQNHQTNVRRQPHTSVRNYVNPVRADNYQNINIYNNYRPQDSGNERPPNFEPPCHFNRYRNKVLSSMKQPPRHR